MLEYSDVKLILCFYRLNELFNNLNLKIKKKKINDNYCGWKIPPNANHANKDLATKLNKIYMRSPNR